MTLKQLEELLAFCHSLDSNKLATIMSDAGHPTIAESIVFDEIVRIHGHKIWVEFINVDTITQRVTHHGQVSFVVDGNRAVDLEIVYFTHQ